MKWRFHIANRYETVRYHTTHRPIAMSKTRASPAGSRATASRPVDPSVPEAKLKYFQHAGALLTADGTDDDLIKLEGTPRGYRIQI